MSVSSNGVYLNYYNNSLNNLHNNNKTSNNFNIEDNNDVCKLKQRITDLEEILYTEREEYKDYYRRTKDGVLNGNNIKKINDYDNINERLREYITLNSEKTNEIEILLKRIKTYEEDLKNKKAIEIENNVYKLKIEDLTEDISNLKKENIDTINNEIIKFENLVNFLKIENTELKEENNELKAKNIELKAHLDNANNFKSDNILPHIKLFDFCVIM